MEVGTAERRAVAVSASVVVLLPPGLVLGVNCALPLTPEFPDYLSAAAAFSHGDDDYDDALITVCPPG